MYAYVPSLRLLYCDDESLITRGCAELELLWPINDDPLIRMIFGVLLPSCLISTVWYFGGCTKAFIGEVSLNMRFPASVKDRVWPACISADEVSSSSSSGNILIPKFESNFRPDAVCLLPAFVEAATTSVCCAASGGTVMVSVNSYWSWWAFSSVVIVRVASSDSALGWVL